MYTTFNISETETIPFGGQDVSEELLCKAITTKPDGTIIADVGGIISDNSKDVEGDSLDQDKIDFSFIKKGFGKIKYEHPATDKNGNVDDMDDPKRWIGVIDSVIRKGKETEFQGRIIAKPHTTTYALAKAVIDDLKTIEELNKRQTAIPKRTGWSVEGAVIRNKKTNQIIKTIVNHVVYTTKPVNSNSVARLLKSMEAGYGYDIADKTGGRAIVKESIQKKPIHFLNNGETTMKYSSQEHAYKSCLSKGLKDDEAKTKAAELWAAQEAAEKAEGLHAQEAHEGASTMLKKAIKSIGDLLKSFTDDNPPFEAEKKAMAKSLKPTGEKNDEIDVGAFLKSMGEVVTLVGEHQVTLAKSQDSMLKALESSNELLAMSLKKSIDVEKELANVSYENLMLRKAIGKGDRGVTAANGGETIIEDEGGKTVTTLTTPLAKSGLRYLLSKSTDQQERLKYQRELVSLEAGSLSDVTAEKLIKGFNDKSIPIPVK